MRFSIPRNLISIGLLALLSTSGPALAGPPPFTTTELIAGNNAPTTNGANLLAAVAAAGPFTLIKLEPGTYDLRGQQINLPDFVDIEGSGRDITFIFSDLTASPTPTVIDVGPGINGEIRELTVQVSADRDTGITTQSDELLLTEVNLELKGEREVVGVRIRKASPRLDEVFVRVLASGGNATGFLVEKGGPVLFSCLFFASDVSRQAFGVFAEESQPTIEGSILFSLFNGANTGIAVVGSTSDATIRNVRALIQGDDASGVRVLAKANARIKESSFNVASDKIAEGIYLEDSKAKATESTFNVSNLFGPNPNVFGARLVGRSDLDSNQSNYESTSFAVENFGVGRARFGASQLIGSAVPPVFGPLTCVFTYDGSYAPLNNFCN
ncbi:MAG: hypothetical protein AAFX85_02905 [Pseudomonadota bacterium]